MTRILVIERRADARACALLATEGFTVVTAVALHEALHVVATFPLEMVLLEVAVLSPEVVGACRALEPRHRRRSQCSRRPAPSATRSTRSPLVLTSSSRSPWVPTSSSPASAALRRRVPVVPDTERDLIAIGPVLLDRARRELFVHGQLVVVPRREFDIAEILMRAPGRVVTRQAIVRELWGSMRGTKSLDVQVGRLRNRLAAAEGRRRIETVRGVGFRFLDDSDERAVPVAPPIAPMVIDLTTEVEEPASQ